MPTTTKDALQQEGARRKLWELNLVSGGWIGLERLGYGNRGFLNRVARGKKRAPRSLLVKLGIVVPGTKVSPRKNWKKLYLELAALFVFVQSSEAICGASIKSAYSKSLYVDIPPDRR